MREEFVKETEIKDINSNDGKNLYEQIEDSKNRLNSFYENMNFVDGSLVDYYVYQIKAEEAKYRIFIE